MHRWVVISVTTLGLWITSCGGGDACDLPDQWSTATAGDGSTCQVNIFADQNYAVYCGGTTGNWDCACGAVADNPPTFVSTDFCDINDEERVCQAIERCNFPF